LAKSLGLALELAPELAPAPALLDNWRIPEVRRSLLKLCSERYWQQ
jgi:hypothetical protein